MNNSLIKLTNVVTRVLTLGCLLSSAVHASPWLEANDPFLRSSLLTLSDAGIISAPVGQYPMRWSEFGDDLKLSTQPSDQTDIALQEVSYALNSARLNRGNRYFKAVGGRYQPVLHDFGSQQQARWGATASYEYLANSFAFRLSSGYRDYDGEQEFSWHDSYLAFNAGAFLVTVGNVDRWWGQGWQHSLILTSAAKDDPDVSLSYSGKNTLLGVWNIETIVNQSDVPDSDYYSGTRFVSRPLSFVELGATYQYWQQSQQDKKQWVLDGRFSLPSIKNMPHSLYGEISTDHHGENFNTWLMGWTGSYTYHKQTLRLVLEHQQKSDSAIDKTSVNEAFYTALNSTFIQDDSYSAALYVQLSNDSNIQLTYQSFTLPVLQVNDAIEFAKVRYQFPALAGKLTLGIDYPLQKQQALHNASLPKSYDETNVWSSYEFRF